MVYKKSHPTGGSCSKPRQLAISLTGLGEPGSTQFLLPSIDRILIHGSPIASSCHHHCRASPLLAAAVFDESASSRMAKLQGASSNAIISIQSVKDTVLSSVGPQPMNLFNTFTILHPIAPADFPIAAIHWLVRGSSARGAACCCSTESGSSISDGARSTANWRASRFDVLFEMESIFQVAFFFETSICRD